MHAGVLPGDIQRAAARPPLPIHAARPHPGLLPSGRSSFPSHSLGRSIVSVWRSFHDERLDNECVDRPPDTQVMDDKRTGATVKGLKEEDIYSPAEVSGAHEVGNGQTRPLRAPHNVHRPAARPTKHCTRSSQTGPGPHRARGGAAACGRHGPERRVLPLPHHLPPPHRELAPVRACVRACVCCSALPS